MEDKTRNNTVFITPVSIGVVGHCDIDSLSRIKQILQELEGFDLIFFKTSSGRLWIKEGTDANDDRY